MGQRGVDDAAVLPGAMWSAPLWPTRLSADSSDTRTWVGWSRPAREQRIEAAQRGHGRPAALYTLPPAVLATVGRRRLHSRAGLADDRERLVVAPPRATGRQGSMPAAKQPSLFHRFPMPAIVRWSSSASPIPARRILVAQPAQELPPRRARAPGCPARARPAAGRTRVRDSVISSSTGPRSWIDVLPLTAHNQPGGGRRRAFGPHPPGARHAQMRVDHQVALEAQEEALAVDVHRAHRAPAETLGPAVAAEARVRGGDLVRHAPSSTGRMRLAA